MSGGKITHKRDLFRRDSGSPKPTSEDVCLSDLSEVLGKLSGQATKLELQDNITACSQSVDLTMELEVLCKIYRERMRGIKKEIRMKNKNSGRYKGNTASLNKINEQKSN